MFCRGRQFMPSTQKSDVGTSVPHTHYQYGQCEMHVPPLRLLSDGNPRDMLFAYYRRCNFSMAIRTGIQHSKHGIPESPSTMSLSNSPKDREHVLDWNPVRPPFISSTSGLGRPRG